MRLRLPPDSRAILGRWRVPALVSTLLLVARSAPIGIPSTVCDTAGDLAVTYCNASQSGLCVNSTFECDVLGGIGEAGVGCSAGPCFCCKQATRRPTCADVSSASVSRCLTIHSGLCSANSEDCSALGGFFVYDGAAQPFGCGDDCGCCREVGCEPRGVSRSEERRRRVIDTTQLRPRPRARCPRRRPPRRPRWRRPIRRRRQLAVLQRALPKPTTRRVCWQRSSSSRSSSRCARARSLRAGANTFTSL
ncbi:hypothetical protein M885DRAFT_225091 [Pelagophyceae sp. CCMP2097]|nr:hypothetical protein M885DRAFT_225091 [Pelagophyceae sp. CCMP2097]